MRRLILPLAAAAVAACASAGPPPGGPEDHSPPQIISLRPDSGQLNAKVKEVQFQFDEVVSDRPTGAASLDRMFLISPRNGEPRVSWHRSRISVRPERGFRDSTAYRITMLPGIADLRGNVRKDGATLVFSTGPTFPTLGIVGTVFDWAGQAIAKGAYVEAVAKRDTTVVYLTASDSSGQFDLGPLPAGNYTVRALIDQNSNRVFDRNEKWDSASVSVAATRPSVELDLIERDSVPPAFANVTVDDSVTITIAFDKPLDPTIPLQPALVALKRADSSDVTVTRVEWAMAHARARAAADSARRADSLRAAGNPPPAAAPPPTPAGVRAPPPPRKPKSPAPERAIVATVSPSTPMLPGQTIRVTTRALRNLLGKSSELTRTVTVPRPAPRDTSQKARPDSAKAPRRPPPRLRP
ncbi:MAG TPA: Ig-like domain-containing protein [Gemmatimonadaceae bacterium]|nr:Ig-like domain-containing protein [Gemmatimonadaceae bacterium]